MALDPAAAPAHDAPSRFLVDLTRPLPDAGGGLDAWAATNTLRRDRPAMALRIARDAPVRADVLEPLSGTLDHLLSPLGHGPGLGPDGLPAWFLFAEAPPGPSLSAELRPWSEGALLNHVLRPIAEVLLALEAIGVTHRGIRPDNVFRGAPNTPVTLGAAWAEPPAMRQPALFEPPYSAACHPAGRGNGSIADDVYALGVLLMTLALGRMPLAGVADTAIIERKLSMGSFAALASEEKLPPIIADLARNMLAEDPEHRPPPALLLDPIAARGRRVAARPPRRAPRPLRLGGFQVWDARGLGFAISREPEAAAQGMRSGEVMQWLRRGLGDAGLAARMEELQRRRQAEGPTQDTRLDTRLLMRVVTQIDPLAPLLWRGVSLWPNALGPLMAAEAATGTVATEIIAEDVVTEWSLLRSDRADPARARIEAQRQRATLQTRGAAPGPLRLLYALNPLLPCRSPGLGSRWVGTLADLPPALEAQLPGLPVGAELLDGHMLAFIVVRAERRLDQEVNGLGGRQSEGETLTALLRLLAALQARFHPRPLPAISAWIAARGGPLVELWHNRPKRAAVAADLNALAAQGMLPPMLTLITDATERSADSTGADRARQEMMGIDLELTAIAEGAPARADYADRVGQEIVAGAGLAALAAMLLLAATG